MQNLNPNNLAGFVPKMPNDQNAGFGVLQAFEGGGEYQKTAALLHCYQLLGVKGCLLLLVLSQF